MSKMTSLSMTSLRLDLNEAAESVDAPNAASLLIANCYIVQKATISGLNYEK